MTLLEPSISPTGTARRRSAACSATVGDADGALAVDRFIGRSPGRHATQLTQAKIQRFRSSYPAPSGVSYDMNAVASSRRGTLAPDAGVHHRLLPTEKVED